MKGYRCPECESSDVEIWHINLCNSCGHEGCEHRVKK